MKNCLIRLFLLLVIIFTNSVFAADGTKRVVDRNFITKSIANYTSAIQSNPNSQDGYINRAYLNYLIGNYQAAIEDYNMLIKLNPKNEEFYLNRGYLKHISNMREDALADYNEALKINPKYAFAYNNRGVALAELGKPEDSMLAYNTAIKINPEYADAYYNRGNLKTQIDNNEDALEDFNAAIKLNPTDSALFNNRGVVKRKLNCNVGALSDFTIAIKLNPEDITALANRGRLKKRYFDSEGAEEDFKSAIAVANESPILVKEMEIQSQIAEHQREKIQSSKETASPKSEEPKIDTSIQKIAHNQAKNTVETKPEAIKVAAVKTNVVMSKPKSDVEKETSLKVNSSGNITTKPVSNPQLAECYYIRALQKYILQNRECALKDFNLAIQYNPEYAEAYYYRAAIKRDLKDDGFVDDYKKAISLDPSLKAVNDADVLTILKI